MVITLHTVYSSVSKNNQISELKIRKDIHDMDKRIERKLKHIKNELFSDNVELILEYFDAMKM